MKNNETKNQNISVEIVDTSTMPHSDVKYYTYRLSSLTDAVGIFPNTTPEGEHIWMLSFHDHYKGKFETLDGAFKHAIDYLTKEQ